MPLPLASDPSFPQALKQARESRGLKLTDVAKAIGISPVMPGRYEDRSNKNFVSPSQKTWDALNDLFFGTGNTSSTGTTSTGGSVDSLKVKDATIEELVNELRSRGAKKVDIGF